jgi:hypothetical protein
MLTERKKKNETIPDRKENHPFFVARNTAPPLPA